MCLDVSRHGSLDLDSLETLGPAAVLNTDGFLLGQRHFCPAGLLKFLLSIAETTSIISTFQRKKNNANLTPAGTIVLQDHLSFFLLSPTTFKPTKKKSVLLRIQPHNDQFANLHTELLNCRFVGL